MREVKDLTNKELIDEFGDECSSLSSGTGGSFERCTELQVELYRRLEGARPHPEQGATSPAQPSGEPQICGKVAYNRFGEIHCDNPPNHSGPCDFGAEPWAAEPPARVERVSDFCHECDGQGCSTCMPSSLFWTEFRKTLSAPFSEWFPPTCVFAFAQAYHEHHSGAERTGGSVSDFWEKWYPQFRANANYFTEEDGWSAKAICEFAKAFTGVQGEAKPPSPTCPTAEQLATAFYDLEFGEMAQMLGNKEGLTLWEDLNEHERGRRIKQADKYLMAFAAFFPLAQPTPTAEELLNRLITDLEPNGYPLWFNRAVQDCEDCDSEDLCVRHYRMAESRWTGCEAEVAKFVASLQGGKDGK